MSGDEEEELDPLNRHSISADTSEREVSHPRKLRSTTARLARSSVTNTPPTSSPPRPLPTYVSLSPQSTPPRPSTPPPDSPFDGSSELDVLKLQLIDKSGDAIAITAALKGAGGYGKTTLERALAHDADVQTAYFDGVLWVELGVTPDSLRDALTDLTTTLTGTRISFDTVSASSAGFADALGGRRILLVLDDAWRYRDVRPFINGGPNTTRLITTQIERVVPDGAVRQTLMTSQEATRLLAWGLQEDQAHPRVSRMLTLPLPDHPLSK